MRTRRWSSGGWNCGGKPEQWCSAIDGSTVTVSRRPWTVAHDGGLIEQPQLRQR
ncbi:conjugal transfer protein [Sesbania bispinosa]|nr:conjugal transfer protein [Sesbania bispinosa]